jgi:hypothetical protein
MTLFKSLLMLVDIKKNARTSLVEIRASRNLLLFS